MATRHIKKCVVPHCGIQGLKGFSKFPTNALEQEVWMRLCGLSFLKPSSLICHKHFNESCFVDHGAFGLVKQRRLKNGSKPELFLPHILLQPERILPQNDIFGDVEIGEVLADQAHVMDVVVQEQPDPTNLEHDYDFFSTYWGQNYQALLKDKSKLEKRVLKLEKILRLKNRSLDKYRNGKLPKDLVKKVCQDNLIGPGKFLSKAQLNWMLETTAEKPRERSREWENDDKRKVCYYIKFSINHTW